MDIPRGTRRRLNIAGADISGSTFDDVNISGWSAHNVNTERLRIDNANLAGLHINNANTGPAPASPIAGSRACASMASRSRICSPPIRPSKRISHGRSWGQRTGALVPVRAATTVRAIGRSEV